jgi:hypothetical protein
MKMKRKKRDFEGQTERFLIFGTGLTSGWQSLIPSVCLFHSELQAHIVLPLQAYRCLYPLGL